MKYLILFIIILNSNLHLYGKITLPSILTDNMVLQQKAKVRFWGESTSLNQQVTVYTGWDGKEKKCNVLNDGSWTIDVDTPHYGGPYSIIFFDGDTTELKNILIGEVWLCSGQSNMQMPLGGWGKITNYKNEIENANYDHIRFLQVARRTSSIPLEEAVLASNGWEGINPNTIVEFSATAYFFARELYEKTGIPIGLIHSSWGGTCVEAWTSSDGLKDFASLKDSVLEVRNYQYLDSDKDELRNHYTVLYNAMIHPFTNYTIKGVIWYQGENNADKPFEYRDLFSAMINDWRVKWNIGVFPFYYVQLANFRDKQPLNSISLWAHLRDAQKQALNIKNTGMVVAADIGEAQDIHPKNKQEVGRRLGILALSHTYKFDIVGSGPLLKSYKLTEDKVKLKFNSFGSKIVLKSSELGNNGFAIAGDDGVFYPANINLKSNSIILSSENVSKPKSVRYGWADNPDLSLYNTEGLPASPFEINSSNN